MCLLCCVLSLNACGALGATTAAPTSTQMLAEKLRKNECCPAALKLQRKCSQRNSELLSLMS
eukprot:8707-Heterococcus_DN1.PRE.4